MVPESGLPSDDDLVRDFLRTRSEAAFLRLYDRHTGGMYRFACRLAGGPGPVPDDLVQESRVRALDGLTRFRGDSSLRTWLCGIVFNRWRDGRRRAGREQRLTLVPGGLPTDAEASPALGMALGRAMEKLPEPYRQVILLHDVEGFTHGEIGQRFGIAEGTSKSQLHRARRALRELLEAKGVADHDR